MQRIVTGEFTREPKKWLLEIVVRLRGNIVVLQVLLAVERNLFGLDLSILNFHLVSNEDDGNILADTRQITVPIGHVLVRNATGDIKHDNGALALDIVAISEAAKLFLARRVPNIEFNWTPIGIEEQRMNLDTERGHIFLLEFSGQVALHKRSLADTPIAYIVVNSENGAGGLRVS